MLYKTIKFRTGKSMDIGQEKADRFLISLFDKMYENIEDDNPDFYENIANDVLFDVGRPNKDTFRYIIQYLMFYLDSLHIEFQYSEHLRDRLRIYIESFIDKKRLT